MSNNAGHQSVGRLIITADDAAVSYGIDRGISALAKLGVVTCVAAFANFNRLKELRALIDNSCAIAIHFNLSSGKPICAPSLVTSLVDSAGEFYAPLKMVSASKGSLFDVLTEYGRAFEARVRRDELALELRAQWLAFQSVIAPTASFSSVHHDLDKYEPVLSYFTGETSLPPSRQVMLRSGRLSGFEYVFAAKGGKDDYEEKVLRLIKQGIWTSRCREGAPFELAIHPAADARRLNTFTAYLEGRETEFKVWSSRRIVQCLNRGRRRGVWFEFDTEEGAK